MVQFSVISLSYHFTPFVAAVCNLTHEQSETHGCILSTVATDALVLEHQAISIHNAD